MEVYADIVFVINFVMDFILLWVAGKIARQRIAPARVAMGAALMALLYCAIVFVTVLHTFYHILFAFIILMAGIGLAFAPKKPKTFCKLMLLSYVAAFFLGGIGMALFYSLQYGNLVMNITQGTAYLSLPVLLAAVALFYALFKIASRWLDKRVLKRQVFFDVKIFFGGRDVALNALVDTGNSLRDPLSQAPVIVAEFNSVKDFLPDGVKLLFYENEENNLQRFIGISTENEFSARLRMIPYESLGKPHGVLLGFRPDKVEIIRDKDVVIQKNVVIGIYNFRLSNNGAYQGLLNPELIG